MYSDLTLFTIGNIWVKILNDEKSALIDLLRVLFYREWESCLMHVYRWVFLEFYERWIFFLKWLQWILKHEFFFLIMCDLFAKDLNTELLNLCQCHVFLKSLVFYICHKTFKGKKMICIPTCSLMILWLVFLVIISLAELVADGIPQIHCMSATIGMAFYDSDSILWHFVTREIMIIYQ